MKPRDRVRLFESVEDAGGVILSASEQLDPSTPEGRFAREVFLGVARMQWEKYRDDFDRAKAAAMERGAAIGPTPFGYARAADGALVEHPEDGRVLRRAFEPAAAPGPRSCRSTISPRTGAAPGRRSPSAACSGRRPTSESTATAPCGRPSPSS